MSTLRTHILLYIIRFSNTNLWIEIHTFNAKCCKTFTKYENITNTVRINEIFIFSFNIKYRIIFPTLLEYNKRFSNFQEGINYPCLWINKRVSNSNQLLSISLIYSSLYCMACNNRTAFCVYFVSRLPFLSLINIFGMKRLKPILYITLREKHVILLSI